MDVNGIREAVQRRPFEVFSIRLADGREITVTHPEAIAIGERRVIVVHPDDSWSVVEPLLIVSLDPRESSRD